MDHSIQMNMFALLAFSYMPYEHAFTIIISWSLSELTWTWHIAVAESKKSPEIFQFGILLLFLVVLDVAAIWLGKPVPYSLYKCDVRQILI